MSSGSKISLVFFGSQQLAADILEIIIRSGRFDLKAVVTQPDRPTGRKQEIKPEPIQKLAERHGWPVLQPEKLTELVPTLRALAADIFIVFHYGSILPQEIIQLPRYGTVNLHPSLLPKYRGASPIRSAIVDGHAETGLTIMLMDEQMDHGPILAQKKMAISPDDTAETFTRRLIPVAGDLLLRTIAGWVDGAIQPRAQNDKDATFCKLLARQDGEINWPSPAQVIYDQYRGLTGWPGVFTFWNGRRLKIIKMKSAVEPAPAGQAVVKNGKIYVGAGDGRSLEILELQIEGKKPITPEQFLSGHPAIHGSRLGA